MKILVMIMLIPNVFWDKEFKNDRSSRVLLNPYFSNYLIPIKIRAPFIFAPLIFAYPKKPTIHAPLTFAHWLKFAPL